MNQKALASRANLYAKIRQFFADRNVLEVETPLLCQHTVTDPHIESFAVPTSEHTHYYLQTSPEYAMKRLIAAGSGCIYQITKAFRRGEAGSQHNPEFTMLEWYRMGFDHRDLMCELDELLQFTIDSLPASKMSYRELFLTYLNIDPFTITLDELKKQIQAHAILVDTTAMDHDTALQILLSHLVEPKLGVEKPLFLYDFPASQAALSKIRQDEFPVAERFELYINGSELANGFHELTNAAELQKRFEENQLARQKNNQRVPAIDHHFINALESGMPTCAGVAVGLDRLLMQQTKKNSIGDIISFPFNMA